MQINTNLEILEPRRCDTPDISLHILAIFPHAQEAKLLKGGAVNQCYCVRTPNERVAFRLGVTDPARYGFDRVAELAFYREGERLGLSPPIIASDPSKGILVTQYIDGDLVDELVIRTPGVLSQVVTLMQTLHRIESSESGEGKTIKHTRFFMNKLEEHHELPPDWEKFVNQAIAEMPSSKLVLCHNDLAFNLLGDKVGRLWAIDFECAGWNQPVFDLAFLCIWYEFTEEEKQQLLNDYSDNKISTYELNSAIRLGLLFSALWSRLEVVYGKEFYQQQANDLYQRALAMRL